MTDGWLSRLLARMETLNPDEIRPSDLTRILRLPLWLSRYLCWSAYREGHFDRRYGPFMGDVVYSVKRVGDNAL